jgi:hypothetical protein
MITIALILAAAATAGVAGGSLVYRKLRARPVEPSGPPSEERGPIALGDVVMLDGGHGRELWAARELSFREGDGPPFLVLFEADGRKSERAILAWEPAEPDSFAVLEPTRPPWGDSPPTRLPTTLEAGATRLSLRARRSAKGVFSRAPEAEGKSDLPFEGAALVGVYRGGAREYAVVVRDTSERAKLYVGRSMSLSSVSVLNARV